MEEKQPEWLNETLLASALQGGENSESRVTIVSFSIESAVPSGNNYTSYIYRVKVEYKVENTHFNEFTSLIVKVPHDKGIIDESTKEDDIFAKEIKVYNELLPYMYKKIGFENFPKSFYSLIDRVLVLKDLKEDGYVMCEKSKQLDYPHCEKVLTALAKFHATSASLYHENQTFVKTLGKEIIFSNNVLLGKLVKPMLELSLKVTGEILNEMQLYTYADFIISRSDRIWHSAVKSSEPKLTGLNVINHGDLTLNNLLFKYNDFGEVTDVKLIDYQVLRYASPVLDIINFIWTSANEEVRKNRLKDLFDSYLNVLNNTLEQLGCPERLSIEELQEDLHLFSDWALIAICFFLPIITSEPEECMDMKVIDAFNFDNEEFVASVLRKPLNGKTFKRLLPTVMKQLDDLMSS